jgi:hypothetical protein
MALIACVYSGGIGMDNRQAEIITGQTPPEISPLLPIHRATTQSFERGLLLLRHSVLLWLESDPGSARLAKNDRLSSGVEPGPFQGPASHQSMHRGSRSHADIRALRHQWVIDHSLRQGPSTIRNVQHRGLKFLVQYITPARRCADIGVYLTAENGSKRMSLRQLMIRQSFLPPLVLS